jgi:hypothetical protein
MTRDERRHDMATNETAADGPMTCEVCGKSFPSREALQEHQREDHDMDPPADLAREIEDPPPADLYAAGPSTGETPASPVQHGA